MGCSYTSWVPGLPKAMLYFLTSDVTQTQSSIGVHPSTYARVNRNTNNYLVIPLMSSFNLSSNVDTWADLLQIPVIRLALDSLLGKQICRQDAICDNEKVTNWHSDPDDLGA